MLVANLVGAEGVPKFQFLEAFADFLLSTVGMLLPDPFFLNQSPGNGLINVRNASIYGLSQLKRSGPLNVDFFSSAQNHHLSVMLCADLEDHFKADGLVQISTFFYETPYEPAVLSISGFKVNLNLTLLLPRIFDELADARVTLEGIPEVTSRVVTLTINGVEENGTIASSALADIINAMSSGPFGPFVDSKIAKSIKEAISRLSKKIQTKSDEWMTKIP